MRGLRLTQKEECAAKAYAKRIMRGLRLTHKVMNVKKNNKQKNYEVSDKNAVEAVEYEVVEAVMEACENCSESENTADLLKKIESDAQSLSISSGTEADSKKEGQCNKAGTYQDVSFRLMRACDIKKVREMDEALFSDPWQESTWLHEINGRLASWIIMEKELNGETVIAGWAGFWLVAGEAQIFKVAVDSRFQGQGLGVHLVHELIATAKRLEGETVTLEVRESNFRARDVYKVCGFFEEGCRKDYYSNKDGSREAAVLMRYNMK